MILDLFRLDGQVALVTGAGGGIGRSIAFAMAEAGADVACVDLDLAAAEATAASLRELGRRSIAAAANVAAEADVVAAFARAVAELGPVDIAFANAGISEPRFPLIDAPLADWQRVIDVDLTSVFLTAREAARIMVPRRRGRIISTASIIGFRAHPENGLTRAYAAAKAGVVNFTRNIAVELAPHNIRCNAIAPTFLRTNIAGGKLLGRDEASRKFIAGIEARTPMGRLGEPDEIKGPALFLASDASSLVTGHTLAADGGWLSW